jgi:glycine cleavage system protein P-like pyridoxal-binding family
MKRSEYEDFQKRMEHLHHYDFSTMFSNIVFEIFTKKPYENKELYDNFVEYLFSIVKEQMEFSQDKKKHPFLKFALSELEDIITESEANFKNELVEFAYDHNLLVEK